MTRFDSGCNLCGSVRHKVSVERADGIPIMVCQECGHGVVQYFPDDVNALYGDEYFAAGIDSPYGYTDYESMAEHGTAWATALVNLLRPSGGRILDIGCADGCLLRKLDTSFEQFGIEMNARFSEQCTRAGIRMIGSDLLNRELQREHAGSFDIVSAIAVFEHIPDLKGSFEAALGFLKPEGLLLFEVPVLSEGNADNAWLHSSFEHIHYPTEKSLDYLFRNILQLDLAGTPVVIRNFGSTYIGLASKSSEVTRAAASSLDHWLHTAPRDLLPAELTFRWLLDLIHAGNTDLELIALSSCIDPRYMNQFIMRRLFELWKAREERCRGVDQYLSEVEDARNWHANESAKKDQIIAAQQTEIAEAVKIAREASDLALRQAAEADRRLASLREMVAGRDIEAEHRIQALEAEVERQKIEAELANQRIRELEASWSWRLTKPLRALVQR
jgi:SAM-dependent methyltransferase